MEAEKATYSVSTLCRVMKVSKSGYYSWRSRPPSQRAKANAALTEKIRRIHRDSRGTPTGLPAYTPSCRLVVGLGALASGWHG